MVQCIPRQLTKTSKNRDSLFQLLQPGHALEPEEIKGGNNEDGVIKSKLN